MIRSERRDGVGSLFRGGGTSFDADVVITAATKKLPSPSFGSSCRSPMMTGGAVAVSEGAPTFSAAIRHQRSALGTVFSGRVPMDDDDG